MPGSAQSCLKVAEAIETIRSVLRRNRVITDWVQPDRITDILSQCQNCLDPSKRKHGCLGWRLAFRHGTALAFTVVDVHGTQVVAKITGTQNACRSKPCKRADEWQKLPVASSSFAVEVYEVTDCAEVGEGALRLRQHVDLADPKQRGPVWHVQAGGKASAGARDPSQSLDVPRWPSQPYDLALTVELVVYSFFPDEWAVISQDARWKGLIRESEGFLIPHYKKRFDDYLALLDRGGAGAVSWLAHQCNSVWNPRP